MSSIFEQYRQQRRKLVEEYIRPVRITFNPDGFDKMRSEYESTATWNTAGPSSRPNTYAGFPYEIVSEQVEEIKLHGH